MRIALLCNDRIALPAVDQLLASGLLTGIGVPRRNIVMHQLLQERCARAGVPLTLFSKAGIMTALEQWLNDCKPDVVLVKTFPYLIPSAVLSVPRYGFLNFHYAPLPEYRGSNPLFWMIRGRASAGAVSVHVMTDTYDTGPIVLQQPVPLLPDMNYGLFYTQLAYAGVHTTGMLLNALLTNTLQLQEQDHSKAQWYGRPVAADLFIHWHSMEAVEVQALIHACNPWNKGAATRWNNWMFGISHAHIITGVQTDRPPGTILAINVTDGFTIACKGGAAIRAEVVYCEEGFYPGHKLSAFGLQAGHCLA